MFNGILIDLEWILMDFEWIWGWWIEMFVVLKPIWQDTQDTGFNQFEHVWTETARQGRISYHSRSFEEVISTPDFAKPWLMKIRGVLLQ